MSESPLTLLELSGSALEPYIDALGSLRISVFRDWPYLYEGSLEYERDYLRTYVGCERSLVVLVMAGGQAVGATTCMPMAEEAPEFQAPFGSAGHDLSRICYLGESILLPEFRGRGLGRMFFEKRHAHAAKLGSSMTTFCAVDRAVDDPRRPALYRPLDEMWTLQGYVKQPQLQAHLEWQEVGETQPSQKTLTFWTKEWTV
jgi:GNAT superfamily N-acetyltransferase